MGEVRVDGECSCQLPVLGGVGVEVPQQRVLSGVEVPCLGFKSEVGGKCPVRFGDEGLELLIHLAIDTHTHLLYAQ